MLKQFFQVFFFSALLIATTSMAVAQHNGSTEPAYIPQRVYDTSDKRFADFETMLAELAKADFVFVGEQHDDPATHRLERAILEGLLRRRGAAVIVAMEMFERDVQPVIDDYFAGKISEEEFLKKSRPWPRYQTDYRPIVEFAKAHGWKLVASNVPRAIARKVSQGGLGEIDKLPTNERGFAAKQNNCPMDDYYKRFVETMTSHPGANAHGGKEAEQKKPTKEEEEANRKIVDKFYYSQCVKDETMGESVADAHSRAATPKPVIVHYNGAFHSDYKYGTTARAQQRAPQARSKVVSIIPVDSLDAIKTDEYKKRGDYLLFCLKPPAKKEQSAEAK